MSYTISRKNLEEEIFNSRKLTQSFTDILLKYDNEKLDLNDILNYCVTARPWVLVNEDYKIRQSRKSLLRNHLQGLCLVQKTATPPDPIKASIEDAMRFLHGTPITGLPK